MTPLHSPNEYLFHLYTTSSGEAKRMWRQNIKEEWNHKCAYCESEENLTIDHIVPQSKGGLDTTKNVVCCCKSCNHDKGHTPWEDWYHHQNFFTVERKNAIVSWMNENKVKNLYTYRQRKNICY
jgi:CRISPR/Cas system Type II protein with McrA/HNH and RuvC-like nuclease domain